MLCHEFVSQKVLPELLRAGGTITCSRMAKIRLKALFLLAWDAPP